MATLEDALEGRLNDDGNRMEDLVVRVPPQFFDLTENLPRCVLPSIFEMCQKRLNRRLLAALDETKLEQNLDSFLESLKKCKAAARAAEGMVFHLVENGKFVVQEHSYQVRIQ